MRDHILQVRDSGCIQHHRLLDRARRSARHRTGLGVFGQAFDWLLHHSGGTAGRRRRLCIGYPIAFSYSIHTYLALVYFKKSPTLFF